GGHGNRSEAKQGRENQHDAKNREVPFHRASLEGLPVPGETRKTRAAISAANRDAVASMSFFAACNSPETRSLALPTSTDALVRASFKTAARSSRSFFLSASCSA